MRRPQRRRRRPLWSRRRSPRRRRNRRRRPKQPRRPKRQLATASWGVRNSPVRRHCLKLRCKHQSVCRGPAHFRQLLRDHRRLAQAPLPPPPPPWMNRQRQYCRLRQPPAPSRTCLHRMQLEAGWGCCLSALRGLALCQHFPSRLRPHRFLYLHPCKRLHWSRWWQPLLRLRLPRRLHQRWLCMPLSCSA